MTKAGKLIDKLKATPKTFKWAELAKNYTRKMLSLKDGESMNYFVKYVLKKAVS